jgi:hypothetical protein
MTYEETKLKLLTLPWKRVKCTQETCWCAGITTEQPVEFEDDELYVVRTGSMYKEVADHIIKIHNETLIKNESNKEKDIKK